MEGGRVSPIVQALATTRSSGCEIRVHLSRMLWDWMPPVKRAWKIFVQVGLDQTQNESGVLLYVNLRLRRFSIIADRGIVPHIPSDFWEVECRNLAEELVGTHPENAIARSVERVGRAVEQHFSSK